MQLQIENAREAVIGRAEWRKERGLKSKIENAREEGIGRRR